MSLWLKFLLVRLKCHKNIFQATKMDSNQIISFLSNFFLKQDLNWQTFLLIGITVAIVNCLSTVAVSFLKEKSKNFATRTDFEQLTAQLVMNTEATKKIDAHFSERVWINQQIWSKKQECYESIFLHLEKITSYVRYEVSAYEEHTDMNRGPYSYYANMSKEQEDKLYAEWQEEVEAYEARINSPEEKLKREELQKENVASFLKLTELMQIKAVFIDEKVQIEVDNLQRSLSIKNDPSEDWDMHFMRMNEDTNKALKNIKDICRLELNL